MAEKRQHHNRVDSMLFGSTKAEEIAKQQHIREQSDAKIRELKAQNSIRPATGHRVLRPATGAGNRSKLFRH